MHRQTSISLAVLLLWWAGLPAAAREWRDITGQYSREGEFVALHGGEVQLKLADGRSARVPLDKLSATDREFVAEATKPKVVDPFVTEAKSDVKMVQAVLKSDRVALSETLPTPDAATFAAMQDMDAAAGAEAVDHRRIRKFVYYGCHSTTHLIDLGPTSGYGTIHYCWGLHHHHDCHCHDCCDHGCCGSNCIWYLAYLKKYKEDPFFLYYTPFFVNSHIDMWAFAKHPTCCGCKYRIWYRIRQTGKWYRFDCASLVRPK